MRYSLAAAAAFAGLAVAAPQGVTSAIAPSASPPAGCSTSYSGSFQIQTVNVTSSHSKRQTNILTLTLNNGILKDANGRTGYIAANSQFQFDNPPQTGAIYTAGFSVCGNGSLAIGGSAIWYQCLSGTFYNLYEYNTAGQCNQIYIEVISASGGAPATSGVASQRTDGQPQATPVSSARVSVISDGQPQAPTSTPRPVSQISDGQVQATTGTARPVSQISDGQVQATTGTARPVSQISDGQVQATTGTARPVSQISDGQPQAPVSSTLASAGITTASRAANVTVTSASATVARFTGAAVPVAIRGEFFGLAAAGLAAALL